MSIRGLPLLLISECLQPQNDAERGELVVEVPAGPRSDHHSKAVDDEYVTYEAHECVASARRLVDAVEKHDERAHLERLGDHHEPLAVQLVRRAVLHRKGATNGEGAL